MAGLPTAPLAARETYGRRFQRGRETPAEQEKRRVGETEKFFSPILRFSGSPFLLRKVENSS
jgi:hypothetical protein